MTDAAEKFSRDLKLEFDGVLDEFNGAVRALSLEALRRVVLRTPVDTGRARGNWFVEFHRAGSLITEDESKTGSLSIARGSSKIGEYKNFGSGSFPAISLYNNLPYIDGLENGRSKRAPEGMVAVTVAELQSGISL